MSAGSPILVSLKSNWDVIDGRPTVGKDVLELLSSSMYVDALSIYREYVQNSADSIEEAAALGLLGHTEKGRVDLDVNVQTRSVRIRDNGTGLKRAAFGNTLVALGASKKRGTKARGFRGVGRLAGLGYCQELVFRSRADGETEVSELRWDCRRLKAVLRDPTFGVNVEDLIKDVVRVRHLVGREFPERFFEVELSGIIRHGNDSLVSPDQIRHYLSQVAPVPFAPTFRFGKQIENALRSKVSLGNVLIYLNGSETPIYRPHVNEFEARKGVVDRFEDIEFFDIRDSNDCLAATGWFLHHGYRGAIESDAFIKGLRLRSGNMQVGESRLLDELFVEPRFNSWTVGEILPNGRRDHFEQNIPFMDLLNRLTPKARELSRRCRLSSLHRNVIRQFEVSQDQANHNLSVVKQGAVGLGERKRLEKNTLNELKRMEKICSHTALGQDEKGKLHSSVRRLRNRFEKAFASKREHRALKRLRPEERKVYERFVSLVYECSMNKAAAKQLIDKILARI
jgi:hypothetical protein